jgi:hypothetical protein
MPRAESSDETEQHTQYSDSFSYPRIAGSLSARSVKALMEGEFFFLYIHWRIFCSIIDNGESPRLSALRLRGPRGARVCSLNEYSIITGQARTEVTRKCRAIVEKNKINWGWGCTVRCGTCIVGPNEPPRARDPGVSPKMKKKLSTLTRLSCIINIIITIIIIIIDVLY